MKKNIILTIVLAMLLLLQSASSPGNSPFNIAAGNYTLVPVDEKISMYPFHDNADGKIVSESLVISADGIWILLIVNEPAGDKPQAELLVGRYQLKDNKISFWDDTNCCTFKGKITGDNLIIEPDDTPDKYVFIRKNNNL